MEANSKPNRSSFNFDLKAERDALAEALLDRLMPVFGPIDFNKQDLFREIEKQPSLDELIESLPAESES